jgi:hypothetical protein
LAEITSVIKHGRDIQAITATRGVKTVEQFGTINKLVEIRGVNKNVSRHVRSRPAGTCSTWDIFEDKEEPDLLQ